MTEPGLLAAIAADPGDDLARLVYADWLDEHDQPERAEYLRLHVEIARLEREGRGHVRPSARLRELAADLPREWRGGVGRRVDVWLVSWGEYHKIAVIKIVRELYVGEVDRPLSEAVNRVELGTLPLRGGLLREDAEALQVAIEHASGVTSPHHDPRWPEVPACNRLELREPTPG